MDILFKNGIPEEEGISSEDILAVAERLEEEGLYMHSLMVIRHGKILAEGYYAPFTRDTKHRMYSMSKSFVAGAIGLLCDEGKLKLTDRVHKFFPEFPEEELHPYIKEATVRDLLTMSSPHATTYSIRPGQEYSEKWVESFFRAKPKRPAGTVFCYDTSASFILDVIVERLTGKPFLDYMKDKMLRKLGFSEDAWCVQSPDGYSWGGSGVICTPLDLAKYGYVILKDGNVNGEQLLSAEYAKAARTKQIANNVAGHSCLFRCSGYGYQIWCAPDNCFVFSGLGNSYVFGAPDKDLMVVCTADNQGRVDAAHLMLGIFLRDIVRKASDKPLPENPKAFAEMKEYFANLKLFVPRGEKHSVQEEKIQDVTYKLEENPLGFQTVRLSFSEEEGVLYYENACGPKELKFGLGKYVESRFPESHYSGKAIGTPKPEGYKCVAAGVWLQENQLLIRTNIVDDYLGNMGLVFGFKEDGSLGLYAQSAAEAFLDDYMGFAGGVPCL